MYLLDYSFLKLRIILLFPFNDFYYSDMHYLYIIYKIIFIFIIKFSNFKSNERGMNEIT